MKKTLMTQVTNSIFEVMETMFFFIVEEKQDTGDNLMGLFEPSTLKACAIDFSGSVSGKIYLLIPSNVLSAMTVNFMGQDADSEELLEGTLKEALNMIAGSALTKVEKESYMGLGIPEIVAPADLIPDAEFAAFDTEQGPIASFVVLKE